MEARLAFAHTTLHIALHHIVFPGEIWVEFNLILRAYNVGRKRSIDLHDWAIHNNEVITVQVMFGAAIYMGHRRPYHMWQHNTEKDQQSHRVIIKTENTIRPEQQAINQRQATVPGTAQYEVLEKINEDIDKQNELEESVGRKIRAHTGLKQEFKEEQFVYRSKAGIN